MSVLDLISFFIAPLVDNYTSLNLTAIPQGIADNLGIDVFSGGILASAILLMIMLIPIALWEKEGFWAKLIIGLVGVGFCIAIEWLPTFFMIIIVLTLALMMSGKSRDWISGGD